MPPALRTRRINPQLRLVIRTVLETARIRRARAVLALTSSDGTNLEALSYARQLKPEVRVVMRLFDEEFATTVYRTVRDTYPAAQTLPQPSAGRCPHVRSRCWRRRPSPTP